MILNLLIITAITCLIIDLSGIMDSLKTPMAYILSKKSGISIPPDAVEIPKPFSCSRCMSFWICLFYIIFVNEFTLLNLLLVALITHFSKNITGFISWVSEALVYIENKMFNALMDKK